MPTLAEALHQPPRKDPRIRCGVGEWLRTLPQEELAAAKVLLEDEDRTTVEIALLFQENGMPHQENLLRRHRRGVCSCRR